MGKMQFYWVKFKKRKRLLNVLWIFLWISVGAIIFGFFSQSKPLSLGQDTSEPCVLCAIRIPYHAPCLLDVWTGKLTELQIYDYSFPGVVKREQSTGYTQMRIYDGATVYRLVDEERCYVDLPENRKPISLPRFCTACQTLLEGSRGFVLLDLYDLEAIEVYPLLSGGTYHIREYTVEMRPTAEGIHVEASADFWER